MAARSTIHRHVPFRYIPRSALELQLNCGEEAIRTAFKSLGCGRRVSKRKGFSTDPEVMKERLDFALSAIHWPITRVFQQCFSDEVWPTAALLQRSGSQSSSMTRVDITQTAFNIDIGSSRVDVP